MHGYIMAILVQKWGGTSVETPERIYSVAQRIARSYRQGYSLVIVVSAMGQMTDELIALASRLSLHPPLREMDMLLTAGERISMSLLSIALADLKIPALSLTGSQSGIMTCQNHQRARIKKILCHRVYATLAQKMVAIVAGFQGVSDAKEITTLGRGGSDTSAVALAAVLKAERCEIFTDVDGVYSADPRIVQNVKFWKKIPHDLMIEMATRGAGVLDPRSIELARQFHVPLCVRNSFHESEGTQVILSEPDLDLNNQKNFEENGQNSSKGMEEFEITGVCSDQNKFVISIQMARPTVLGSIWEKAARSHLAVVAPLFMGEEVRFFAERDGKEEWEKHLDDLMKNGFLKKYEMSLDYVPLSVIGYRFAQDGFALHEMMNVLMSHQIIIQFGFASSVAVTFSVPMTQATEGVKALHAKFLENEKI